MPVSVTMPALGESVTEGTVTRWLKQEGEQVQADEPLLEVSTDKVDTEIPSPASGVLTRIVVSEDETVDVGTELAVIGDGSDAGSAGDGSAGDGSAGDSSAGDSSAGDSSAGDSSAGGIDGPTGGRADAAGGAEGAADASSAQGNDGGDAAAQHDGGMDGDAADRAVETAAGTEQADQPSEPAPTSAGSESGGSGSGGDQGGGSGSSGDRGGSGSSGDRGGSDSGGAASAGGAGTAVTMPALGESVTEGTVTRWLKNVGDDIAADEPLLEVSTDKVDTEIPSPVAGTLLEISVNEDETVEVGAQLATIGTAGSGGGEPASAEPDSDAGDEDGDGQPAAVREQPETAERPPAERSQAQPSQAQQPEAQQPEARQAPPQQASPQQSHGQQPQGAPTDTPAQHKAGGDAVPAPRASSDPPAPTSGGTTDAAGSAAYVTPLVRKLAAEHAVDLSTVRGTGVGGRIRKQDVLEAAKPAAASEPATPTVPVSTGAAPAAAVVDPAAQALRGRTEKLSRLRAVIAKRMVESLQISAQLTTVVEVDITEIARLRDRAKADFAAREGVKLSFLPFFALATVEALRAHPKVNSSVDVDAGTVTYHDSENLGIAVDTERGLLVPVIHDAGDLNLGGIARKIADLADRTRRNKITPDELSGGTFTLTNTGSRGALFDTPIINQPQSGILGTGTVVKRPVVIDHPDLGEIVTVRSMIYLALSYDHRIVDGADAARFLVSMKQRLEAGDFESALGLG